MPYLQLDVNESYPIESKKELALRMSRTYASMMSVDIRRITVAVRELGPGTVWRIPEADAEPVPVALADAGHPAGTIRRASDGGC